ncbi:hypothetical protein [Pseudophaeobacter sp.]|uniref:hypothetical protein n=1 Tax=Pseudophaeobacter sp. TaxID=1971739 RepID=UPI003298E0EE
MDERETLLQRAKDMGLKPHHSTGVDKLKAMISGAQSASGEGGGDQGNDPAQASVKGGGDLSPPLPSQDDLIEARVLDSLKHNGKLYGPDTDRPTVELTLKEFEALEGCKVVERQPEG